MIHARRHLCAVVLTSVFMIFAHDGVAQLWLDFRSGITHNNFFSSQNEKTQTESNAGIGAYVALSLRHPLSNGLLARYGLEYRQFNAGLHVEKMDGRHSYESDLTFKVHYLVSRFGAEQSILSREKFQLSGVFSMLVGYQMNNRTSGTGWSFVPAVFYGPDGEEFPYMAAADWQLDKVNYDSVKTFFVGAEAGLLFAYKPNSKLSLLAEASFSAGLSPFLEGSRTTANSLLIGVGIAYDLKSVK